MTERSRALAAFDAEHDIPPKVSLRSVDIPFWNLVNLILKFYVATIVASVIVGTVIGGGFLAYSLLTGN